MLRILVTLLKTVGYALLVLVALLAAYVFWLSGSSHQPVGVVAASTYTSPGGPILVFGGNRATGLEVVKRLKARGEQVVVAVRPTSDTAALRALGIATVVADATDAEQVRAAVAAGGYAAVVSTLGGGRGDKARRPDFEGNRNAIDAAQAAGVKRFVLISVVGTGDSLETAPAASRRFLKTVIELKGRAEDHLRASGLGYTIIRPGGLGDVKPSGTAVLADDPQAFSFIARSDLAELVVQALGDPATVGKTYNAYDPSRRTMWKMFVD
ncbi:MAG: SDR family oxidoreductase [Gammaproteobacteria bacterium]